MFDETKVFESDYDVPACSDNVFLFENFGFEKQHFGYLSLTINGYGKTKNENPGSSTYGLLNIFIGNATTSWITSQSKEFIVVKFTESGYSQINTKDEFGFVGTQWCDSLISSGIINNQVVYSGGIKIGSSFRTGGGSISYGSNSYATLQAGTTISLKAYQLNFS